MELVVSPGIPAPGPNDRLSNLSTRSWVGLGGSVQIAGFVVRGSSNKRLLVRACGPSLQAFGLTNLLADPVLTLYAGSQVIRENDDWSPELAGVFSESGAFPWPAGSADAALVLDAGPGDYTAVVTGKNGTEGLALVEVYEVDHADTENRLVNLSTRSRVSGGASVQIAGFSLTGAAPKKVLLRANGPSLVPFGISDAVADPMLQLYSGADLVFESDSWSLGLATDFTAAHAFPWVEGSKDAALVLVLPPGNYTAVVSGKTADAGVGLVEVYEVP